MTSRRSRHVPKARGFAPTERLVIGRNALRELLAHCPERIKHVYMAASVTGSDIGGRRELCDELKSHGVQVQEMDTAGLDTLAGTGSHQSFVAKVAQPSKVELKEFLATNEDRERSLILALDSVTDPHNVGAILRAACCFNIDAVILPRNRGAGVTATVSKTSAGASELVTIIEVANLAEALRRCRDAGYWIAVAEAEEDGQDLRKFDAPGKVVLVVGSEGEGIQDLVTRTADFKVFIPMLGKIASLNVSQATAVILYALRSREKQG